MCLPTGVNDLYTTAVGSLYSELWRKEVIVRSIPPIVPPYVSRRGKTRVVFDNLEAVHRRDDGLDSLKWPRPRMLQNWRLQACLGIWARLAVESHNDQSV